MLSFRIRMEFSPQTFDEAASALRSLVGPVRAETGCRATMLLTDAAGGTELTWVEEWRGLEDFERHLRGMAFRRIVAVIELAAERPAVEIDDVSSRRGFELVEEILGLAPAERTANERG